MSQGTQQAHRVVRSRRAVTVLRTLATWAVTIAVAVAAGKGLQHLRDGNAPPVSSDAPAIDGVAFAEGTPTLVYFWATWCGVCRVESPVIASVRTTLAQSPSCGRVVELEETGNGAVFGDYGVRILPTMVVVDSQGRVAKRFLGFTTRWQILSALKAAGGSC